MDHLVQREWKLRSSLTDDPQVQNHQEELISRLQSETGLSSLTLRVCVMRGLTSAAAIQEFLYPRLESLKNPSCIRDMDRAVDRLAQARQNAEQIRIFGDYDVDGTTGAALLSWLFRDFGFRFDARQPDRFKDGYGLNVKAVEEAAAEGVKLLVTIDCGITSFDAAKKAKELGIDLIIVDHHQVDPVRGIPSEAQAVINPQRTDCTSGLKQLCGCGLGFYLGMALRIRGRQDQWWPEGKEPNLKQHLDLVVMATAADMVPLLGDNHILVRHGLDVLKQSRKPGVRALLEVAGVNLGTISPGHLGFTIGPRINASGRMASASIALELLTTSDPVRAARLAHEIERLNKERADQQNKVWDEVRAKVEEGLAQGKFKHGIVVADPHWHEGVVGIVASRVTETYRKPAAVIALREDEIGKGSVRSYGGKDVLAALRASGEHLLGFGGHKHAAGLSVSPERLEVFAQSFDRALGEMEHDANSLPLLTEGQCTLEELDLKTIQELEKLGPFGPGNPEPVFTFRAEVMNHQVIKGRHLKMNLTCHGNKPEGQSAAFLNAPVMEAIWFNAAEREEVMADGALHEEIEWAGVPELNRFRGRVTPTLRVRDWRRKSH